MKNKKYVFIGVYILLIIIELFFYVPYERIEIFRSKQNVPHTEITGNGYLSIGEIRKDAVQIEYGDSTATGKRVDSGQLAINLFVTTMTAVLIYFIFIYSNDKTRAFEVDTLKKENEMLIKNIEYLYKDNRILCEYKETLLRLKDNLAEITENSNMQYIEEIPTIDINALAFADEETQNRVLEQYTDNVSAYTAYKILKTLK